MWQPRFGWRKRHNKPFSGRRRPVLQIDTSSRAGNMPPAREKMSRQAAALLDEPASAPPTFSETKPNSAPITIDTTMLISALSTTETVSSVPSLPASKV